MENNKVVVVDTEFFKQDKKIETLEDAKKALSELQALGQLLFMKAWEKGWHTELAAYGMQMKDTQ